MFEDEVNELLRELAGTTGADAVTIVHDAPTDDDGDDDDVLTAPLGRGAHLVVTLASGRATDDRRASLERSVRALRACARRWDEELLPEASWRRDGKTSSEKIVARIRSLLEALANTQGCANAVIVHRAQVLAAARELDPHHEAQIAFLVKRVEAEADKSRTSSHGEIASAEVYATSFWYGAYLLAYFDGDYALDFIRHRARLVTREVAQLLPDLDEPPPSPARIQPMPE